MTRLILLGGIGLALTVLFAWFVLQRKRSPELPSKPRTVQSVLDTIGPAVAARLHPHFRKAGVGFPPQTLTLLVLKEEAVVEVFAGDAPGPLRFIRSYPVLAASGTRGPKLREGDLQVPEGFYRIESLNPNSRFHLSLRVNYPNDEDRERARAEGRAPGGLGSDIMIHGGAASIGCVAVGDPAAEELFVLAARTGPERISLLMAPKDFRVAPVAPGAEPAASLDLRLQEAMQNLRRQPVD